MSNANQQLDFSLEGFIEGRPIAPGTVDITTLNAFTEDVKRIVRGKDNAPTDGTTAHIENGSLKIVLVLGAALAATVKADVTTLAETSDLSAIDPARAEIFQKWQKQATASLDRCYSIGTGQRSTFKITKETRFVRKADDAWVRVEKYLNGHLTDMGVKEPPNIHLVLSGSRETLTISATRKQLAEEKENRIYKDVVIRVSAEQNLQTNALRNAKLLEFVHYSTIPDQQALDRLWAHGREAWSGVRSAAAWVENLRGN